MFANCNKLLTPPIVEVTTAGDWAFYTMFFHADSLGTPPKFKCTSIGTSCWYSCFGYSGITTIPQDTFAPNTIITNNCINNMCDNCKSLTSADLRSLQMPSSGGPNVQQTFYYASSLTEIKVSWTKWPGFAFYWVKGVASDGTFYCPSALGTNGTISRGDNNCPSNWTVINTD